MKTIPIKNTPNVITFFACGFMVTPLKNKREIKPAQQVNSCCTGLIKMTNVTLNRLFECERVDPSCHRYVHLHNSSQHLIRVLYIF